MDNLIVMTPRAPGGLSPDRRGPLGGSAEILFFTGVRYFRQVDEAAFLPNASTPSTTPTLSKAPTPSKPSAPRLQPQFGGQRLVLVVARLDHL